MIELPTVTAGPSVPELTPPQPLSSTPANAADPSTAAPHATGAAPGASLAAREPGPANPPSARKPGLFRSKAARAAQGDRDLTHLSRPLRSPRRIAVVGLKGGVGKTTLSVLLSSVYSEVRGDPVLLLDADPTFGSLLLRTGTAPTHAASDLAGRGDPGDLEILAPYLARSAQGPWVLPSGLDPGQSANFDAATFVATMDVVYRHFPIMVIDCGAGLGGGLMSQLLSGAHTLVFASSASVDGLTATYEGLRWIVDRGFGPLVANSFVTVSGVGRAVPVDLTVAARRFEELCRGLLSVPEDPHLAAGARIDYAALAEQTRVAVTHVAAEVLDAARSAS